MEVGREELPFSVTLPSISREPKREVRDFQLRSTAPARRSHEDQVAPASHWPAPTDQREDAARRHLKVQRFDRFLTSKPAARSMVSIAFLIAPPGVVPC